MTPELFQIFSEREELLALLLTQLRRAAHGFCTQDYLVLG
jgi:hypothetical protein